jgi:hypothetical protein
MSDYKGMALMRENIALFCGGGKRAERRGLPGGAEGIRTALHLPFPAA